VLVERGAADAGAVEDLLHGDVVERLFADQLDERIAQRVARSEYAAVRLHLSILIYSSPRFRTNRYPMFGIAGYG
jgi:hypothetical protein